ncbi:hypothetical protein AaE_011485 [Aphanomyces astaci]|uniref:Peptidase M13 C-terminal domain-containing protein n=1 Tax=Aphanomyces astaci TaxID=112090 RepID=A0A6A4ZYI3_APHAT|nr:hypothetical protein AaE_011485 [Aphanomyces astaci]
MSSSEDSSLLNTQTAKQSTVAGRPAWVKYAVVGGVIVVAGIVGVVWNSISVQATPTSSTTTENQTTTTPTPADIATSYPPQYAEFYTSMFANMDATVDPCEDFYQYACGGWLDANDLTDTDSYIDTSFSIVNKNNDKIIHDIMATKPDVIDPFYQACVAEPAVNGEAVADVTTQLRHIATLDSVDALLAYAGALAVTTTTKSFLDIDVGVDPKNATVNVLYLLQGGLTLSSAEYYANAAKYFGPLHEYIANLSAALDHHPFQTRNHGSDMIAQTIFDFEAQIANVSLPRAQLRDPWATYHKFDLQDVHPFVATYVQGMNPLWGTNQTVPVLVPSPQFLEGLAKLVANTDLAVLKTYVSFHLVHTRSPVLGDTFRVLTHNFRSATEGLPAVESRQVYCTNLVKSYLGEYLGQLYLDKAFQPSVKAQAKALIQQIEDAMTDLIHQVDWLDAPTRRVALDKVAKIANFVGGPDSFEPLPFPLNATNFYQNVQTLDSLANNATLNKLGNQVDHTKWAMFAFTANAYNDATANKMVFPAAFLQKPIYGASEFPAVANYARIGVVMGHELTHGFDDRGRNFDPSGQLAHWWTADVKDKFESNTQCLVDQYSTFPVESLDKKTVLGYVNGRMTLGENIADNGGLKLAYMAYQKAKQADPTIADIGYDDTKMFFTAFVQGWWCFKATDNFYTNFLHMDPHSPAEWRAKGPMMNSLLFADAFQCPKDSPMNPAKKCVVW